MYCNAFNPKITQTILTDSFVLIVVCDSQICCHLSPFLTFKFLVNNVVSIFLSFNTVVNKSDAILCFRLLAGLA